MIQSNLTPGEINTLGQSLNVKKSKKEHWNSKKYQNRVLKKLAELNLPKRKIKSILNKGKKKKEEIEKKKDVIPPISVYSEAKEKGFQKPKNIAWNSRKSRILAREYLDNIDKPPDIYFEDPLPSLKEIRYSLENPTREEDVFIISPSQYTDIGELVDFLESIKFNRGYRYLIGYKTRYDGSQTVSPSNRFLNNLKKVDKLNKEGLTFEEIMNVIKIDPEEFSGSDVKFISSFIDIEPDLIIELYRKSTRPMPQGAFFDMDINPEFYPFFKDKRENDNSYDVIDVLALCQIYPPPHVRTKYQDERITELMKNNKRDHCLVYALEVMNKFPELSGYRSSESSDRKSYYNEELKELKAWISTNSGIKYIQTNILRKLSLTLNLGFRVLKYDGSDNKVKFYGHKSEEEYEQCRIMNLGLYNNHYFLNFRIPFSKLAVKKIEYRNNPKYRDMIRVKKTTNVKGEEVIYCIKGETDFKELETSIFNISNPHSPTQASSVDLVTAGLMNNLFIPKDIDEVLKLEDVEGVNDFLNEERFDNCEPCAYDVNMQRATQENRDSQDFTTDLSKKYYSFKFPFSTSKKEKDHGQKRNYLLSYFDTETTTEGDKHEVYMASNITHWKGIPEIPSSEDEEGLNQPPVSGIPVTHTGKDSVEQYLNYLCSLFSVNKRLYKGRALIFVHNLGYDISFVTRLRGMKEIRSIRPAQNKCFSFTGKYTDPNSKLTLECVFRDTYSLCPMPLRDFGRSFNLDVKKEIIPYGLYNSKNVQLEKIDVEKARKHLKSSSDYEEFVGLIDSLNLFTNENKTTFYHMDYAKYYCEQDVLTLKKGFEKFCDSFLEVFNVEIMNCVSISQAAFRAAESYGCFEDIIPMNGFMREFVQKSVEGGKCATAYNKKYNLTPAKGGDIDFKEQVLDVTSLYPSAMRTQDMNYPTGYPKAMNRLKTKNFKVDYLRNKYNSYYVKVRINKIRKRLPFPLLRYVKDGVNVYSDDIKELGKNRIYYFCKMSLEDVVKYHKLEPEDYQVLGGYFFDTPSNNKMKEFMDVCFNERLKYKNKKSVDYNNAKQLIYKLVMNSIYGKTIQKPIKDTTHVTIGDNNKSKYTLRHYNKIISKTSFGDDIDSSEYCKTYFKISKSTHGFRNYVHIGSNILASSKRIMSSVFDICERKNIDVYYTDTDSIHFDYNKYDELTTVYKEENGRELIGSRLGEMHCDYEFDDCEPLYAVNCQFLAKKIYCCKVLCKIDDEYKSKYDDVYMGENKDLVYKYHYRMKGVPHDSVKDYCLDNGIDMSELYTMLFNGKSIPFNMVPKGGIRFEFNKDFTVGTIKKQIRNIQII